jgi:hypothetical protein
MFRKQDQPDLDWRAIYDEELTRWKAKSYGELQAASSEVIAQNTCCVHYEREGQGGTYQVEVQALENEPDYFHVLVSVSEPSWWRALSADHPSRRQPTR